MQLPSISPSLRMVVIALAIDAQPNEAARPMVTSDKLRASSHDHARFWEIDTLRGSAVVAMIVYHLLWDLRFFAVMPEIDLWHGFWKYFQQATASTFTVLVGVSLVIAHKRIESRSATEKRFLFALLRRGSLIFICGLLISLVVWASGIGYVDFGILHLIGISVLVIYPFLRFKWLNLFLWVSLLVIGNRLQTIQGETRWLAPLGIMPVGYAAVDYFPFVPWFGVVLLGVWLGKLLYTAKGRKFHIPEWGHIPPIAGLRFLGRHSFLVYLLHQPVLLAILIAIGVVHL
jgi:uncharacterized membrane protein